MVLHWVQNLDNQRSQEVKEGEADLFGTLHRAVDAPPLANGETRIAPPAIALLLLAPGAAMISRVAGRMPRKGWRSRSADAEMAPG